MARTIDDILLLFNVLGGQDPVDPVSPPIPQRQISLADARRLRIGYFEDDGVVPVTPETRQAVLDAVRVLQKQGFDVHPFRPKGVRAGAEAVVDILCPLRRDVFRADNTRP